MSGNLSLSAISGYSGYENFKNIYFVSANRWGQVNSEARNDMLGDYVGIKGENLINLLLTKLFFLPLGESISWVRPKMFVPF